ncbi:MAG: hypothetical protein VSS75_016135 [Candidatus Parabeggiatoa sp.]|nr:hypothetical protein [Candidatus Parabeggiatoa sp.]
MMVTKSKIDESHKEYWNDNLDKTIKSPTSWEISSSQLFRAAGILWKTSEEDLQNLFSEERNELKPDDTLKQFNKIGSVAMMLYGLSIENLLKAVLIKKGDAFKENGKFKYAHHCLLDLIKKADIGITEKERLLLEKLEKFILWAGRYPLPFNVEDKLNIKLENGSSIPPNTISYPFDNQLIHKLFSKIEDSLGVEQSLRVMDGT